jgi:hypothetical protein
MIYIMLISVPVITLTLQEAKRSFVFYSEADRSVDPLLEQCSISSLYSGNTGNEEIVEFVCNGYSGG